MKKLVLTVFGVVLAFSQLSCEEKKAMNKNGYNKLSESEARVIVHKGTEPPFSGKYNKFAQEGGYHCKRCDALLYRSQDKFVSSCGWPSFDDEVKGAIKRKVDLDGRRTEILCANCDAHLGHVFKGEGYTKKNVRHCVNSISMKFVAAQSVPVISHAYFAGGCFWGVEYLFQKQKGVLSATSGYMGGTLDNPTYNDVVAGGTGHLEVVQVSYDSSKVSFETLTKFFFEIHNPTQPNGQGPDIGEQYLSAIFFNNKDEQEISNRLIELLKTKGFKVVTLVRPAMTFWKAETYHQEYYRRTGKQPYCHVYKKKF